jgi:hypothetical protein
MLGIFNPAIGQIEPIGFPCAFSFFHLALLNFGSATG